jgi:hypothetical protein
MSRRMSLVKCRGFRTIQRPFAVRYGTRLPFGNDNFQMLNRALQIRFWATILGGLIVLVLLPVWGKQSFCSPQEELYILQSWLCGEIRTTDIFIAYFTFCLVVVGWLTLRSTENNSEAIERAYVFPGNSPPQFRNRRVNFKLAMTNAGRSPGVIKEVGYAFLARNDLPRSRKRADWTWEVIPYDWVIPANTRRDIRKVQSPVGDHILVVYIKYQDIFTKRMHTSWMSMHIFPDREENKRITRAGGDIWNKWD